MIYGVLIHLEGVLCWEGFPLPGSREALISLRAAGIPTRIVSENTHLPPATLVEQMAYIGLTVPVAHLFTPCLVKNNTIQAALEDLGLPAQAVALIATDVAEIRGALAAGLQGVLLRTGAPLSSRDETEIAAHGARVFDDLDTVIDAIL